MNGLIGVRLQLAFVDKATLNGTLKHRESRWDFQSEHHLPC